MCRSSPTPRVSTTCILWRLSSRVKAGFHMIKNLPQKVFYSNGTPYQVMYGDKAFLQVEEKELQKLLKKRIPTKGRRT